MLKNQFIFSWILLFILSSCGSVKPSASVPAESNKPVIFIEDISLKPEQRRTGAAIQPTPYNKSTSDKTGAAIQPTLSYKSASDKTSNRAAVIEKYSPLQFKYAILINASVEEMTNVRLLNFMDDWYGTPYHYGGTGKHGIDCSAFASLLMSAVYGIDDLPRVSKEQYHSGRQVHRDELQEGDLVFFHTMGKHKAITHVGVYLRNNRFIHASISGVMISNMGEGYYANHYVCAGRVIQGE